MESSKMPSPLTMNDLRVQHKSVRSGALPASDRQSIPNISNEKCSRIDPAAVTPQRTFLPIVDEENSTTTEDKPAEATHEKNDTDNGSSDTGLKSGLEASYKGKRDPFANEGGGGMKYKTMAWWYVIIIQAQRLISRNTAQR
jgi:hypothetical protein